MFSTDTAVSEGAHERMAHLVQQIIDALPDRIKVFFFVIEQNFGK